MKYALAIQGEHRLLIATVTITTIGQRTAVEVGFDQEPTEGEVQATDAALECLMQELFNGNSMRVAATERINDPAERAKSFRKFLGGGQG